MIFQEYSALLLLYILVEFLSFLLLSLSFPLPFPTLSSFLISFSIPHPFLSLPTSFLQLLYPKSLLGGWADCICKDGHTTTYSTMQAPLTKRQANWCCRTFRSGPQKQNGFCLALLGCLSLDGTMPSCEEIQATCRGHVWAPRPTRAGLQVVLPHFEFPLETLYTLGQRKATLLLPI